MARMRDIVRWASLPPKRARVLQLTPGERVMDPVTADKKAGGGQGRPRTWAKNI